MPLTPQKRAIKTYRARLRKMGVARFEVLALETDRDLIRSLAKRLTKNDPETTRIRTEIRQSLGEKPPAKGNILAALRRSPLVNPDLDLSLETTRSKGSGRKVNL